MIDSIEKPSAAPSAVRIWYSSAMCRSGRDCWNTASLLITNTWPANRNINCKLLNGSHPS